MLGGLNSLVGVFLGCLALGVSENLAGAYVSPSFADAITFIVIIAVLIVRPGRHLRPREGSQGMTGAADIAGVPAGLPKRPTSRGLASPLLVGLGLALACAAPLGLNGYALYLLTLTGIFALVALGLNLLTGYAGQISLCHAAFFGVGAYATALLTQKAGSPYLFSLPARRLAHDAIGALARCRRFACKTSISPSRPSASASCCRRSSSNGASLTGGGGGLALTRADHRRL